jgi:hypothetical protein
LAFLGDARYANTVTAYAALALTLESPTATWEHVVSSIDDALGALSAASVDAATLHEMGREEPLASLLGRAMSGRDALLERRGLEDGRTRRRSLAAALERGDPAAVMRVVGARRLIARFVLRWDADAAWWKALTTAIRAVGGDVTVEVPVVPKPVNASREADPFEAISYATARALDEAPVEVALKAALGDLTFTTAVPDASREHVSIISALDEDAQARAAVLEVARALDDGATVDSIAIALPKHASPSAIDALERYFDEARIPLHVTGRPLKGALLEVIFGLLTVGAEGLPRRDVAALLRSRSLDATPVTGIPEAHAARAAVDDLASTLEQTPSATHPEPGVEQLVATAVTRETPLRTQHGAIARRFGGALVTYANAPTRAARARAARVLFAEVGLHAAAGAGVRDALARDEPRGNVGQHELRAFARDVRLLDALSSALREIPRFPAARAQAHG